MGDITKHFSYHEFACQCGCGLDTINPLLVTRLESARCLLGKRIDVTSGLRCSKHNQAVGGEPDSAHLHGLAADLACPTSRARIDLLTTLLTVGFCRVGIGGNFIHVDVDLHKDQDVCWVYSAKNAEW